MTFNQLRYFYYAANYHSITKAANALFVTQPAVSIAIRDLEREFSISLFSYTQNRLHLTEEGEFFYRKVSYILQYTEDMKMELLSNNRSTAPVKLGIPPMLSTIFFPELLTEFKKKNPDIFVELHEYGSVRACNLVQDEVLDVGLVNMEIYDIDKYNQQVMMDDQLVFCVAQGHPLSGRTSITIEDIAAEPLILFNADSVQNQMIHMRFAASNLTPRVILNCSQTFTTVKFLKQKNCGAFLYKSMLSQLPQLIGISLDPPIPIRVGIVWKKGKYLGHSAEKLIDFIRDFAPQWR